MVQGEGPAAVGHLCQSLAPRGGEAVIEWLAIAIVYATGTVGLLGQIAGAIDVPLTPPVFGVLLFLALVVISFERAPKREPQTPLAWAATILTLIPIAVLVLDTFTTPL